MNKEYKLIQDSPTLLLQPDLAVLIGTNEAIVLQQMHYWVVNAKVEGRNFYDNLYWVFNSYEKWQEQFPFFSVSTIKKTILSLEKRGFLITGNYNKNRYDKTKWYSIDYDAFFEFYNSSRTKVKQSIGQNLSDDMDKINPTNTRDYSIISSKNSNYNTQFPNSENCVHYFNYDILYKQLDLCYKELTDDEKRCYTLNDYIDVFSYFYGRYKYEMYEEHPMLKNEHIKQVMLMLPLVETEIHGILSVDVNENKEMIDFYFGNNFGYSCNYSILHYVSGDIRQNCYYKVCF